MTTARNVSKKVLLLLAEVALAVITVLLLVAIWLPIDDFRAWLSKWWN
jgi:hypothetical protein